MKRNFLTATLGIVASGIMFMPAAQAACGSRDTMVSPLRYPLLRTVSFAQLSEQDSDADQGTNRPGIVGFWHVKFVSQNSDGIPDGTEIDAGYQQWHSDGTEVLNSAGRKPMTGNVCFGVWKQVGKREYKLNHFATPWDDAQDHLIGPTNFQISVTLNKKGDTFRGPFVINTYDESGKLLSQVHGIITGTRIEVDTPPEPIF